MKRYIAHTKGKKDYDLYEGYTRQDLKDNNYVIDCTVPEEIFNKKFDSSKDQVLEFFANICDCHGRCFTWRCH